ncbi:MAG: putative leader peptide [Actinomycetes bacterium]
MQARDEGQTGCHEIKGATRARRSRSPCTRRVCHTGAVYPLLVARLHVDLQRVVSAACR